MRLRRSRPKMVSVVKIMGLRRKKRKKKKEEWVTIMEQLRVRRIRTIMRERMIQRDEGLGMAKRGRSGNVNSLARSMHEVSLMRGKGGQNRMLRMLQLKRQSKQWPWKLLQQPERPGQQWLAWASSRFSCSGRHKVLLLTTWLVGPSSTQVHLHLPQSRPP